MAIKKQEFLLLLCFSVVVIHLFTFFLLIFIIGLAVEPFNSWTRAIQFNPVYV